MVFGHALQPFHVGAPSDPRNPEERLRKMAHNAKSSCRLACMQKQKTPVIEDPVKSAPTAELRREGRLTRIAKALVSGASVTETAEAEGIGRTLASREANSPECRQLLAEFVSDEHDEMRALFYRSLRAIEQALSARREYMTKEGEIIYGGPDHYARLAATKHLRDFLSAGRPAPKQLGKEERRTLTLPELEELLKAK
jgi:hypothetical protein